MGGCGQLLVCGVVVVVCVWGGLLQVGRGPGSYGMTYGFAAPSKRSTVHREDRKQEGAQHQQGTHDCCDPSNPRSENSKQQRQQQSRSPLAPRSRQRAPLGSCRFIPLIMGGIPCRGRPSAGDRHKVQRRPCEFVQVREPWLGHWLHLGCASLGACMAEFRAPGLEAMPRQAVQHLAGPHTVAAGKQEGGQGLRSGHPC